MTIQPKPEQEHVIWQAIQAGIIHSADEVLDAGVENIRQQLEARSTAPGPQLDDEWMLKFRKWAHSHPTDTPLLSDEAISRESIYRERGM